MSSWHAYPKIYALGHPLIKNLLDGPVQIEEKVDGSQFSFGIFEGVLRFRSKGKEILPDCPEKMFLPALSTVESIRDLLIPGWTYSCEFLSKPKHNALAYDRVPLGNLVLFDIRVDEETYGASLSRISEAERLGIDVIPVLSYETPTLDSLKALLETPSFLGGQKIEGVVIKNYSKFGLDGKALMGKYVSEAYKEVHKGEWRKANPTRSDILEHLIFKYRTPARWEKAAQHLRDLGTLEGSPKDIGLLMQEAQADLEAECKEEIAEALLAWALPKIKRGGTAGLAEWYKEKLLGEQFTPETKHET
jgi:hypothetical protein